MTPAEFGGIMNSRGGLFTDAKDYEDIIRLTTKSGKLKTGRFIPNPRSTQITTWKENRAVECKMINLLDLSKQTFGNGQKMEVSLRSDRPILLGGFYCSPVEKTTTAKVTITDIGHRNRMISSIAKSSSSVFGVPSFMGLDRFDGTTILTGSTELSPEKETFFELANRPIVIRPEHDYKIHFELNIQGSREAVYFSTKNTNPERKLDEQTKIYIQGHSLISKFKFNLL